MDRHKRMRGQSLVEFTLCVPLLLLIFLGVFDLGRVFAAYIVITNAARDGAYYGTLHPLDSAGIIQRVITEAQNSGITLTSSNVSISTSGVKATPMCVTVRYDFRLLSSFLLGGKTIRLASRAEMVIY